MANEPSSFFDRLTSSVRVSDEGQKAKRVDFAEPKEEPSPTPSEPIVAQNDPPPAPEVEKSEQWMEEAQEGQLTIDVYQTDTELVIQSTVAGVKSEDVDVSITNDMVTIRGKRTRNDEVSPEKYFYQECYWGPFSRSVILPTDVASDKVEATIQNGILTIRLPKIEKEQTKKIKVKNIP